MPCGRADSESLPSLSVIWPNWVNFKIFFCIRGFFQSSGACWSMSAPSWTPSLRPRQLGWFALCWTSSWTWRLPQAKRWSSVWSASSGPKWRRGPSSDRRLRWDLCQGSSLFPWSGWSETKAEFAIVFTLTSPHRSEYHPDFYNLVDASLNDFCLPPQARLVSLYFDTKCYQEALQLGECPILAPLFHNTGL